MLSRRAFCQLGALFGAGVMAGCTPAEPPKETATPAPDKVTRYVDALPMPTVLKPTSTDGGVDFYEISASEVQQHLHSELPKTTVWGYGGAYPGATIEAVKGRPVKIAFKNDLPEEHLFPVDKSLMGAGGDVPEVRLVTHLHGGHVPPESDGWPEDWVGVGGTQTVTYPNDQDAATLWFHDHAMAATRLNVYAGLAAFYLIRDEAEDALGLPKGDYEIPIALQDRTFNPDASLLYTTNADSDVEDSIKPEDFGNVSVINGKIWPYLEVEPRRYRLRLLNGSNSRFYNLAMKDKATGELDGPQFVQIGSEQGLFAAPVPIQGRLLMAPAERADCIVDFTEFAGREFIVTSDAKTPYKSEEQDVDEVPLNDMMLIRVKAAATGTDESKVPESLVPITRLDPAKADLTRELALVEGEDETKRLKLQIDGKEWEDPISEKPKLGSTEVWRLINTTEDVHPVHLHLVKFQVIGRTPFDAEKYLEAWDEAKGESGEDGVTSANFKKPPIKEFLTGPMEKPGPNEMGWKDTVRANPGYVTDIIQTFDIKGRYVWHCHIIEHEDHVMMRPFEVV